MELFTIDEVAQQFRCEKRTITRAIDKGEMEGIKLGKLWRFTTEHMEAYLKKRTVSKPKKKSLTIK